LTKILELYNNIDKLYLRPEEKLKVEYILKINEKGVICDMKNEISTILNVKDKEVRVLRVNDVDYISLTDLARYQNSIDPSGVIRNWMSNQNSFYFYSLWEEFNNENFNSVEKDRIRISEVGYYSFTMTPSRWKKDFNAIGIIPSAGKYSIGTFAHPDIAFEFASWLSPEFKLYLITEFQRLKKDEAYQQKIEWNIRRIITKGNYKIHTDAIKEKLILPILSKEQKNYTYASEADVLNVALFGITASEWRTKNKDKKGNVRDYATIEQLIVLSNMESSNSIMIKDNISQHKRLEKLNEYALSQLKSLENNTSINKLKKIETEVGDLK